MESYMDLSQRITENFLEIDNDICVELLHTDKEYASLYDKADDLQHLHPFIMKALEGAEEISLTKDEHHILVEYLSLKIEMDSIERRQIYFRGHTDSFAYLKKIGAI
jgi:hypothetical protein